MKAPDLIEVYGVLPEEPMLRTVICDDEVPALELLEAMLTRTGGVEILAAFQSAQEAVERINEGDVDLVVFDVEMPQIGGVDAFQKVITDPRPLLIFATAHPEYAADAFEVDAIDYLLKPLSQDRVLKAIEKAQRLYSLIRSTEAAVSESEQAALADMGGGVLRVKDSGHVSFVPYEKVIWIEAAGDYCLIHTAEREYAVRRAIKSIAEELPDTLFVRVHRSTIIAIQHVQEVELLSKGEAQIKLTSGNSLRSSRTYREAVRRLIGLEKA